MTDELKQWEYDKGYDKGKADMLKAIEDIKAEIRELRDNTDIGEAIALYDVCLDIIDKYKAESEE